MKRRTADPYRDLDGHRRPRAALQPGRRRNAVPRRLPRRLVAALRDPGRPVRARARLRPALVPAVPRLLRGRAATSRRGPDRGRPAAALREQGRAGGARGRLDRARGGRGGARLGARPDGCRARAAVGRDGLLRRLRGLQARSPGSVAFAGTRSTGSTSPTSAPHAEDGLVVQFTHPLCTDCRELERTPAARGPAHPHVRRLRRPELARKYGVAVVPTAVDVAADGTVGSPAG